jgi:hypothetical protein
VGKKEIIQITLFWIIVWPMIHPERGIISCGKNARKISHRKFSSLFLLPLPTPFNT